jgi:hypothetical protein
MGQNYAGIVAVSYNRYVPSGQVKTGRASWKLETVILERFAGFAAPRSKDRGKGTGGQMDPDAADGAGNYRLGALV